MDAKTSKDLDPKLKEVYEKVMGTSFPTQQPLQDARTSVVQIDSSTANAAFSSHQPETPTSPDKPLPLPLKIFLWVLFVIFIGGYTYFWIKFFNIALPF